jgi:putative ABC transport system permease protein
MLRGIITQINGRPANEVADGHWVVQGDRGITYANEQPTGTEVTSGQWWPAGYTGPPQISFAAEEAAEMGLSLGDMMTVNVLGRNITAEVTSFRDVSWEDAGIGFVLAMNQGALAGAPHSWISTVYAEEDAEAAILRDLASAYPNITAIRIRDAIDQVIELVGGISVATRYGALIALITGFLVLIGAAAAGERARMFESAVLKTLGATRSQVIASFALRAAILGLAAGTVALGAGILGGWAVSTYIMGTPYVVIWGNVFLIIGGGILASTLAGLAFSWRPLSAKPAQVLRSRE